MLSEPIHLERGSSMPGDPDSLDLDAVRRQVEAEAEDVRAVSSVVDGRFAEVVAVIAAAPGKVITSAVGNSGAIAARLAHVLSLCGTPALFLDANQALHGSVGAITREDVVIIVSKGGVTDEVNEFARLTRDAGAPVVAVTESADAPLAEIAGFVQVLPTSTAELAGLVGMGSSLAQAAWGDALATALAQVRGLDAASVGARHPRGLVGKGFRQAQPTSEEGADE